MRMRHVPQIRLAVPLLCLSLAFLGGCKGAPQLPQQQTAGLNIDVLKARNVKRGVEVSAKIWNTHNDTLTFKLGDVRLKCGDGVEVSPNATRQQPAVPSKNFTVFNWIFPVDKPLPGGKYEIEIQELAVDGVDINMAAQFQIVLK